uniref:Uncharacterized protein n=1 Tax=Anguilla anguilla TaxID=7936 RepID=A0A0E9WXE5_ANGAN
MLHLTSVLRSGPIRVCHNLTTVPKNYMWTKRKALDLRRVSCVSVVSDRQIIK